MRDEVTTLTASGMIPQGRTGPPPELIQIRPVPTRATTDIGPRRAGLFVVAFRSIAVSLDDDRLPVMHQPIDHGGGQGVVHVEDLAPVAEGTIRGDHDRSGLVAGGDDLEHQVRTAFVDGQIAQFIEEEQGRVGRRPSRLFPACR